ncbi:HesA/MoeB/ThiF family protein [Effusibacillus consociatus]|uniref:HesA/MoeB/ThiF family protein n=1 Tax=Effusibacillus consociatus TaxID=1117041 RepID=A0ABV9Q2S0_9BACL
MNKPRVKEFYRVYDYIENDQEIEIQLGACKSTGKVVNGDRDLLKLLSLCDGKNSRLDIIQIIRKDRPDLSTHDINEVLDHLQEYGLLEEADLGDTTLSPIEFDRYNRHLVYYSSFCEGNRHVPQEKLKNSTVVLIGMGGIGSWLSYALVAAGIGKLIGVDHDHIELSNLTRQILYSEQSVGMKKVAVAKERLRELNSKVEFISVEQKVQNVDNVKKIIKDADFVVLSADSPEGIHYWVDRACYESNIPYTSVGYLDNWGICGPLTVPNKTSCLICEKGSNEIKQETLHGIPEIREINSRAKAASFGPLNGYISCFAAMEVIKYLTGYAEPVTLGRRYMVNSGTMETEFTEYPRNPNCPQCGNSTIISERNKGVV